MKILSFGLALCASVMVGCAHGPQAVSAPMLDGETPPPATPAVASYSPDRIRPLFNGSRTRQPRLRQRTGPKRRPKKTRVISTTGRRMSPLPSRWRSQTRGSPLTGPCSTSTTGVLRGSEASSGGLQSHCARAIEGERGQFLLQTSDRPSVSSTACCRPMSSAPPRAVSLHAEQHDRARGPVRCGRERGDRPREAGRRLRPDPRLLRDRP